MRLVQALERARFYTTVTVVYSLTVLAGWYVLHPPQHPRTTLASVSASEHIPKVEGITDATITYGKPVRIVIPASGIDLPVDEGYYDASTSAWTLSGYRAQFAMASIVANTASGDTLIYGHNNNYVFGALRHNTPDPGAEAYVYTDNGHIFLYNFVSTESLTPDDVDGLYYIGPPRLTILTCTGALNEWRTLYHFNFERLVQ